MLKGAIVGFGKIAQTGHVPAYLSAGLSDLVKISAIADPNGEYRDRAAGSFPGVSLYESLEELLAHEELDFIDICTPPSMHARGIAACVERNIHILCEKPFTATLAEAKVAAELLKTKRELAFVPCHQYHYSPLWQHFKEAIDEWTKASKFLLQFNVYRLQPDPGYLASNPNWRVDPSMSGGGILADTGVHYLYLIYWMLGEPRSVNAILTKLHHSGLEVEDTALVSIECERGVAQMALTWGASARANSARLSCSSGSLVYDGITLQKTDSAGSRVLQVPDAADKSTYVQQYVSLIREFCAQIKSGGGNKQWVDEAYSTIQVLDACYRSSQKNEQVSLPSAAETAALNYI